MFLEEKPIDEVFISDHFLQTVLGWSILDEEKKKLAEKHSNIIKISGAQPEFCLDAVSSANNSFTPLQAKDTL